MRRILDFLLQVGYLLFFSFFKKPSCVSEQIVLPSFELLNVQKMGWPISSSYVRKNDCNIFQTLAPVLNDVILDLSKSKAFAHTKRM